MWKDWREKQDGSTEKTSHGAKYGRWDIVRCHDNRRAPSDRVNMAVIAMYGMRNFVLISKKLLKAHFDQQSVRYLNFIQIVGKYASIILKKIS